ncbi:MAG: glycoside hydrolase family 15 protein [Chloroflexota bacterium]
MGNYRRPYRPIGDYGLIVDGHERCGVAVDGSIDWCCLPRFDSPAVFCRLLDAERGGRFQVSPAAPYRSSRAYVEGSNVLATTFTTGDGRVRLTDLMPPAASPSPAVGEQPTADGEPYRRILRLVEGLSGEVEVKVAFRPTFDYARAETELITPPGGAVARSGSEQLSLACPAPLAPDGNGGLAGMLRVAAGDRLWFVLSYRVGRDRSAVAFDPTEAEAELVRTLGYWRSQGAACSYEGPHRDLVHRSALVLKLLTYQPTGAIIAAPTTSLPEEIGGVRNWDYRYTWLRDAALILYSLQSTGFHAEATGFFDWLQRLSLERRDRVRIMYTVDGGECLPERTLDHLEGYRGSRPVRIGNGAAGQNQLDVYGEVLDAAHLHLEAMHKPADPGLLDVLRLLADRAAARWREPDQGIWEVRGGPRHFVYSKLLCWVALDRALRLAERKGLTGDLVRWRQSREAIRQAILTRGYDPDLGAFTQALGEPVLDASALAVPLVGFLPPTDPRVRSTIERIRERLTSGGLVYRYLGEDGLPGGEATFALCSFWLVDNLALAGRVEEARGLFERIVGYANDLGLMSEEIAPERGELLGNYPQGFTHLALTSSAVNIAEVEEHGQHTSAETRAERLPRAERAGRVRRE